MDIEIKYVTVKDAVEGLERIFRELQDNNATNDKWDWMGAWFYLDIIKNHVDKPE